MYPLNKIIVGLDLSELDPTLIKFAALIAKVSSTEKIYFINVIKSLHIPDDVKKEFPGLAEHAIKERMEKMEALVKEHFTENTNTKIKFAVKQGSPSKQILKMSVEKDIDLLIAGRKSTLKGSGVIPQRLARRAGCALLIVPEGAQPQINKILVPSDFSDYSIIAMEEAIEIALKYGPGVQITCQNVFNVPAGYHYTGKSFEDFAEIMKKHAQADYKKFIKKVDKKGMTIKTVYSLDDNDDPVEDIYMKAKDLKADAIVIGAKGRTAATALFIGSMAERLVSVNDSIPMMVVRPKGKNAGLWDYLRDI